MCYLAIMECFSESMIVPFFPREQAMNLNSDVFGSMLSTNAVSKLICSMLVGLYIVEIGPKKAIYLAFLTNSLGIALLGVCPLISESIHRKLGLALSFLSFTMLGGSSGSYITASYAIILDAFPDTFAEEIGYYEIFSGVASVLGPVCGGLILQYISDNFIAIGILGFLVGFVGFVIACVYLIEFKDAVPSKIKDSLKLLKNVSIILAFVSLLFGMGIIYALQALLEPQLSRFLDGTQPFKIGLPLTILGIFYGGSAPLWGKFVSDRPRIGLVIGSALLAASCFCFDGDLFIHMFQIQKFEPAIADFNSTMPLADEILTPEYKNYSYIHFNVIASIIGLALAAPVIASYQEMNNVTLQELNYTNTIGNLGLISTCWNLGYSLANIIGPVVFGSLGSNYDFYTSMQLLGWCFLIIVVIKIVYYYIKYWRTRD